MFNARLWNVSLRTAHIAAMGVLLGGHAFVPAEERDRLLLSLWLTIATGTCLGLLETGGRPTWFHQGRGLMTLAKLGLLCTVPFLWDYQRLRLAVLVTVVVIASVGSHMPARFRYYSVLYRKILDCREGPGTARLNAELISTEDLSKDE